MCGVVADVVAEEVTEALGDVLRYPFLVLQMGVDEGGEGCEEPVGQGFAIYLIYYNGQGEASLLFKGGNEVTVRAFVEGVEEGLSNDCSAALVAEDIAHGGDICDDLLAVIEAGVGSSAEDAGYAGLVGEERLGSTEHVTIYRDAVCRGEQGGKDVSEYG